MKHILKPILVALVSAMCLAGCSLFNPGSSDNQIAKVEKTAQWIYGGYNGANSSKAGDLIANLRIDSGKLYYAWTVPESVAATQLGSKSSHEIDLVCCLFVKNKAGKIVGGKFEWISISRKSREFTNIYKGYAGWNLSDVPSSTEAWFCIVNPKTNKRTNFIQTTWNR